MGSGVVRSSDGASTSTGGSSTSTGWVSAERRRDRIQSNKDLIRATLDFEDEDEGGWGGCREFEWMEDLKRAEDEEDENEDDMRPGSSVRRRIRLDAKTTQVSSRSPSCQ